jgi:hypothetical protein
MDLAIESPTVSAKARREFVINFFSDEVKYFDAINHFIRERRPVRCDYRGIVFAGFARRILLLAPSGTPHYILRILGRLSTRLSSQDGASSSSERSYAGSDSRVGEKLTTGYHNLFKSG